MYFTFKNMKVYVKTLGDTCMEAVSKFPNAGPCLLGDENATVVISA